MAIEEYLESEVAVAVAATALALSPRARRVLRRGVVYGLAGALKAGDAIASFSQAAARGAQDATASMVSAPEDAPAQPADLQEERGNA
jgi:nucleoside phosphorylase